MGKEKGKSLLRLTRFFQFFGILYHGLSIMFHCFVVRCD